MGLASGADDGVKRSAAVTADGLYKDAHEALQAVRLDYQYWTGKLTDTSLQLSFALIGANWACFGSVDGILAVFWAKVSVALVIVGLVVSVAGARLMGELHCRRIDYAEENLGRWNLEFIETMGKRDPWPFTRAIEWWGRSLRFARTWLPLAAGAAFVLAVVVR